MRCLRRLISGSKAKNQRNLHSSPCSRSNSSRRMSPSSTKPKTPSSRRWSRWSSRALPTWYIVYALSVRAALTWEQNQPLLSSSLQTAHNLRLLPDLVSNLLADLNDAVVLRITKAFDPAAIGREVAGKGAFQNLPNNANASQRARLIPQSNSRPGRDILPSQHLRIKRNGSPCSGVDWRGSLTMWQIAAPRSVERIMAWNSADRDRCIRSRRCCG
jgi:hypothetical protein